ncbi:MAG: oxidative damage protection protein [Halothiobacillus sp. 24-54-40]|jgi:Fe-S cluster biosynthesis and repair protein YggX|nr:MAG: oxidative damage protection protein [Halothiobacillus sp. 20-53-49]OYY30984.1 MAG: oxidative damage protection protein [Halothiobacillus sp. 35-54-62]OYZ85099.1 MAG: oxidative damage protection protein [Halothiobacillus sp. 24-54-40]OZA78850.1 MAG: oxidative damage protection protein [Halothiobacillus sp. 39-53-45]HQS03616.1 oxidative damage protection protein [Halothiobacillus sp.]
MSDAISTTPSHERMVFCARLQCEAKGLVKPPYPGALGQRIFEGVSESAWLAWRGHQTMLINEYRLSPIDPKARQFLEAEMEKFLFGGEVTQPEGYVPPEPK